jgi:hypothetical protein
MPKIRFLDVNVSNWGPSRCGDHCTTEPQLHVQILLENHLFDQPDLVACYLKSVIINNLRAECQATQSSWTSSSCTMGNKGQLARGEKAAIAEASWPG